MQHTQLNFVRRGCKAALAALLILAAFPAAAGTITGPSKPDPLLDGGPTADYAAGTDATGAPVVPADVGASPVPVPDVIAIPLARKAPGSGQPGRGDSAYVSLDGRKLAPLLNPAPCH
jgi:hypothetical protein